jgi:hypothetical protein
MPRNNGWIQWIGRAEKHLISPHALVGRPDSIPFPEDSPRYSCLLGEAGLPRETAGGTRDERSSGRHDARLIKMAQRDTMSFASRLQQFHSAYSLHSLISCQQLRSRCICSAALRHLYLSFVLQHSVSFPLSPGRQPSCRRGLAPRRGNQRHVFPVNF